MWCEPSSWTLLCVQFVGEVDQGVVKGLHNWIQLYMEEGQGNLKYLGYMNPRQCAHLPSPYSPAILVRAALSGYLAWRTSPPTRVMVMTHSGRRANIQKP